MKDSSSPGERFAQELAGHQMLERAQDLHDEKRVKSPPYARIGSGLVDIEILHEILQILIDNYTVDLLNVKGDLITPGLLDFQQWVVNKYPIDNPPKTQ